MVDSVANEQTFVLIEDTFSKFFMDPMGSVQDHPLVQAYIRFNMGSTIFSDVTVYDEDPNSYAYSMLWIIGIVMCLGVPIIPVALLALLPAGIVLVTYLGLELFALIFDIPNMLSKLFLSTVFRLWIFWCFTRLILIFRQEEDFWRGIWNSSS